MADPGQRDPHLAGDLLEGGSRTARRLPRWLGLTTEVLVGSVVAGFVVVQGLGLLGDHTPDARDPLQVVKAPEVSAAFNSATVTVDLQNVTDSSLILDSASILASTDDPTGPSSGTWGWSTSSAYAPSWVSANLYPPHQALVASYDSRIQPLEVPRSGGTATLVVTVTPPCQRSPDVGDVEVVVAWHTNSGGLGQETVAEILQNGETHLADLVDHLCATAWNKPPEPFVSSADLRPGRTVAASVKGLPVTFTVPGPGWERFGALAMSTGTKGADAADAVVFATDVQGANGIRACGQWWGSPAGTLDHWARSAAGRRTNTVVQPPEPVSVGGASGVHVVVRIDEVEQCRPGLHHTWRPVDMRAPWTGIQSGDTVRIWLLRAGSQVVYVEADTHRDASPQLRREVAEIVSSLQIG